MWRPPIPAQSGNGPPAARRVSARRRRPGAQLGHPNGILGADATEVADTLDQLGLTLVRLERFREADQTLAKSQHIRERASEQAPLALAQTYELVALLHRYTDNYQAALPLIDRALDIQRRLSPNHPDGILALQTRGDVLLLMGDASGAERSWKSALDLATRSLRADHPAEAVTFAGSGSPRSRLATSPRRGDWPSVRGISATGRSLPAIRSWRILPWRLVCLSNTTANTPRRASSIATHSQGSGTASALDRPARLPTSKPHSSTTMPVSHGDW